MSIGGGGWSIRLTGATGKCINEISNNQTADDSDDSGKGDGSSGLTERDTTDENNGFHTLTEYRNQGQDDQSPLSGLGTTIHIYHIDGLARPKNRKVEHQRFPSKASWSFTLHLAFALSILSIVIPTIKMRIEAISEKIPSHNSSDFFQRSEA